MQGLYNSKLLRLLIIAQRDNRGKVSVENGCDDLRLPFCPQCEPVRGREQTLGISV